jgi:two-component system, NtrC family, response regulator AtoC
LQDQVNQTENTPLLIVDDDKTIRNLLAKVAERAGFQVDTAKDGLEALEMLQQKNYAIAIVDLMMPRLSGYELVQKISALNPRPTVIVATAMANGDVASLEDSMVRRVLRKPFDIETVAKALVETARQIAEQQEVVQESVVIAGAEAATIPVKPPEEETTEEIAAAPPDETPAVKVEEPPEQS